VKASPELKRLFNSRANLVSIDILISAMKEDLELIEVFAEGFNLVPVVSIVDSPAIGVGFEYFNSHFSLTDFKADEDKGIIVGPVMIPDLPIYRRHEDKEFNVFFSKQTVEEMFYSFAKNTNHKSITLMHRGIPVNAFVSELWLTGKNDKSKDFGFDLPEGTWFWIVKVEDKNVFENLIKSELLKGFSVEIPGLKTKNETMKFEDEKKKEDEEIVDKEKEMAEEIITEAPVVEEVKEKVEEVNIEAEIAKAVQAATDSLNDRLAKIEEQIDAALKGNADFATQLKSFSELLTETPAVEKQSLVAFDVHASAMLSKLQNFKKQK
jgi:hypothetical protein